MDQVAIEFVPRLLLDDRRRQAQREALLAVASSGSGSSPRAAARFGSMVVQIGRRLERRGARRALPLHAVLEASGCAG